MNQVLFKLGSTPKMTTSKQFDYLNRLTTVSSVGSSLSPLTSHLYQYNDANQRTRATLADSSYWVYEYDTLGQVKSGKRYWSDGTPVAGQQFEYGFDDIGNRASTKAGGDSVGAGLRAATYTANTLNQYSSRTVPGAFDVLGAAKATASVTVNSVAATTRKGEYYHKEVTVANSSVPVYQSVTVTASEGGNNTTASGSVFTPKTAENFGYDADGNEITDGRWSYTWDGENRLTRLVANTAVGPQQRIDLAYDWKGRRISKKVWNNTAGTGTLALDERYLYDGWNLLVQLNATNNVVIRSYMWGSDLSGQTGSALNGAGGVGGLLEVNDAVNGAHFCAYDGNGNVVALVKASDGTISANYEYYPFGNVIRATGLMAFVNPFRFSTKFQDDESGLLYYGYRYLNASTGRWLSRDPIGENSFLAHFIDEQPEMDYGIFTQLLDEALKPAYALVANNSVGSFDNIGLATTKVDSCKIIVWFGHNYSVPQGKIDNADCSAAAVVSCGPTKKWNPATPTRQIPGTSQTAGGTSYKIYQAERIALSFFDKGVAYAKDVLCKDDNCKCKCKKIVVRIECAFGMDVLGRASVGEGVCGKEKIVDCDCSK